MCYEIIGSHNRADHVHNQADHIHNWVDHIHNSVDHIYNRGNHMLARLSATIDYLDYVPGIGNGITRMSHPRCTGSNNNHE